MASSMEEPTSLAQFSRRSMKLQKTRREVKRQERGSLILSEASDQRFQKNWDSHLVQGTVLLPAAGRSCEELAYASTIREAAGR
jgi:hypothetical protein